MGNVKTLIALKYGNKLKINQVKDDTEKIRRLETNM
jgi:hypothetical protein